MNKYLLYVAVFAVVFVLLAHDCDGKKAALKKRSLKSQKIDMSVVKDKVKESVDKRAKRAITTPGDKIRQKRRSSLSNSAFAEKVKAVIPEVQHIEKKLARHKRASNTKSMRARMLKSLKKTNRGGRKRRAVNSKAPSFAKSQIAKLSKVGKNIKRFHSRK